MHCRIVEGKEVQHQCRIEHLGAEAVLFHLSDTRMGIPSARMLLEAFADLVRRKQRRVCAIFFRHAFFPKIHRFHDVRILRDNNAINPLTVTVADCHVSSLLQ